MTGVPAPHAGWGRGLGPGLFLVSFALLGLESALARVLSALMRQPFAVAVISAAVPGLILGGLVLLLFPERFPQRRLRSQLGWAAALFSAGLLGLWGFFLLLGRSPQLAAWMLAPFSPAAPEPLVAGAPLPLLPLAALWLLCAAPLVPCGFVAALLLARFPGQAAVLCGWASAGAGLGWLGAFLALTRLDPFAGIGAFAAPAALAALVFLGGAAPRLPRATALGLAVAAAWLAASGGGAVDLKFARGRHQPGLLLDRWSPWSRVTVYPLAGRDDGPPGVSRRFTGLLPEQLGLAVDDAGPAAIVRYRPGDDLSWARADLRALPYLLRRDPRTLILGGGGGRDLLIARANGQGPVRAVEPDPLVLRAVQEDLAEFSGRPYRLPGVEAVVGEERAFLRRDAGRYDVLQVAAFPGGRPASAGGFAGAGETLVTVEALHDALERLEAGGIIAISQPAEEGRVLRVAATARAALAERGAASPGAQLFIAAERGLASVLVKAGPFTVPEVTLLERRCRELDFAVWYSPAREGAGPLYDLLQPGRGAGGSRAAAHEILPVTDDRPFLAAAPPRSDFFGLSAPREQDPEERALSLLGSLLAPLLAAAAAVAALPLALRGRTPGLSRPRAAVAAACFGALGLGFIVVQISLLGRLLLLLGRPSGALAAALGVFLIAGALGSRRSQPLAGWPTALRRKCALLVVALVVVAALLPVLVELLIGSPPWARLLAAAGVLAPLGYLMGQPFPLGVALVRARDARLAPWLWSVSGAFFALGSAGTLALCVHFGLTAAMMVGPASYLVAAALAEEL